MDLDGFTLDVYMQRTGGQDYWDGIYDPIDPDPKDTPEEQEATKRREAARVAEADKRRELTRNLKQRLAYFAITRWPATPPGDTWKIGCAVRAWLVGEHGKGDSDAGKMPVSTIVEMLGPTKEPPKEPRCRLSAEDTADGCFIHLDGKPFPANEGAVKLFQAAIDAGGEYVSMTEAGCKSRQLDQLPQVLLDLLDRGTAKGTRLLRNAWLD